MGGFLIAILSKNAGIDIFLKNVKVVIMAPMLEAWAQNNFAGENHGKNQKSRYPGSRQGHSLFALY